MFGNHFSTPLAQIEPPKDVPPPTPVNFPRYAPEITANGANAAGESEKTDPAALPAKKRLTDVLQSIVRPTELNIEHFQALGVRIHENADPTAIIPNYYEHVPDFATWDDIPYDQARDINDSTRRPISNGSQSPGILVYLDRKRELSIDNIAAYRTVRRMPHNKALGQPAKLGNAYEFFRHLDNFSSFWDDTSVTPPPAQEEVDAPAGNAEGKEAAPGDEKAEETTPMPDAAATDSESKPTPAEDAAATTATTAAPAATPAVPAATPAETPVPEFKAFRSSSGSQMPSEYRLNMTTAFLKLVAYDFGCNVSAPRAEPRLYLNTGSITAEEAELQDKQHKDAQAEAQKAVGKTENAAATPAPVSAPALAVSAPARKLPASIKYKGPSSYFTSGCVFVFRSPTTREAARAGFVDGPLAAISARHTTSFPSAESSTGTDRDTCIDLARELVAALVTAQHRAREGRAERRIGKGKWWATKPRWGGGPGGPIGREVDSAPNTDEAPDLSGGEGSGGPPKNVSNVPAVRKPLIAMPSSALPKSPAVASSFLSTWDAPRMPSKKPRKGMAIYDNYRMVRAPSSSWDKKTRYSAIGRSRGADYDDIFVVSALFHHVSIVRVRVPDRLLAELDGASYKQAAAMAVSDESLRGLHVIRSPWYDLFKTEDRLAGMRLAWGMMAYLMRVDGGKADDVPMKDA